VTTVEDAGAWSRGAAAVAHELLGIGVDGAPGGWVAACCFGTDADAAPATLRSEPRFFASIQQLADWRSTQPGGGEAPVAVDIPIGLPDTVRYRACDEVARSRLPGPRRGSVFHPPARYMLEYATEPINGKPPAAKVVFARVQELVAERQRRLDQAAAETAAERLLRLSQQGSAILLKVAEVDAFLREPLPAGERGRQRWLFEVHPEMCFRAMNDGHVPPPKTTAHGQLERLDLVRREFPDAERRIRAWPEGKRSSLLDVCDAYAALWTALRWARTGAGAPERRAQVTPPLEVLGEGADGESPREEKTGLRMRMVV
jgi:predicted RNase H-like nuclease